MQPVPILSDKEGRVVVPDLHDSVITSCAAEARFAEIGLVLDKGEHGLLQVEGLEHLSVVGFLPSSVGQVGSTGNIILEAFSWRLDARGRAQLKAEFPDCSAAISDLPESFEVESFLHALRPTYGAQIEILSTKEAVYRRLHAN